MPSLQMSSEQFQAVVRVLTARGFCLKPRPNDPTVGVVPLGDRSVRMAMEQLVGADDLPQSLVVRREDWERFGGGIQEDFAGLVEVLRNLQQVPDATAQTVLTVEEAAKIRALGFAAKAGPWRVPPLPDELVVGDGLLECLGETWRASNEDIPLPELRAQEPEAAVEAQVEKPPAPKVPPFSDDEKRVLRAVHRLGVCTVRTVQQALWRMGAERFHRALDRLVARGTLRTVGHMIVVARSGA